MTPEELEAYFSEIELPKTLRLDRASTQHGVGERVKQLLHMMKVQPENWRHEHQLLRIKNALENPYDGPGIPAF